VPLLLVLPATVLFVVFFLFPMLLLAESSLHDYSRLAGVLPGLTPRNYLRILGDSYYLDVILRTLRIALSTCTLSLLLGYPVALYLHMAPPRQKAWIILCILSPLLVSVIVRTFGWLIILGPHGGVDSASRALGFGGLEILHSELAVVLGLVNVLLPFLVLSIVTSLQSIDPALPLAAGSLGANPVRVFARVILPLTLPGMVSGLLIVFSLACSSFVTPALLGGGDNRVLAMVVYEQAMVLQNWPLASAVAAILVLIVLLVLFLQSQLTGRARGTMVFH
jgi:putative spermidine/putrescine transport system permease protein